MPCVLDSGWPGLSHQGAGPQTHEAFTSASVVAASLPGQPREVVGIDLYLSGVVSPLALGQDVGQELEWGTHGVKLREQLGKGRLHKCQGREWVQLCP